MEPVFVLAPGRSYTTLITAMTGQHPQLYGMPELNLNATASIDEWWHEYKFSVFSAGLLRAVAQLYFGGQTEQTIMQAWYWIRERHDWSTTTMYHELANRVHPRALVEKSPRMVTEKGSFERLLDIFPKARFIHLTRHPRSTCQSYLKTDWVKYMFSSSCENAYDYSTYPPTLDPQMSWYTIHNNICNFLQQLPESQAVRIRGEDLVSDPDPRLLMVAEKLGLSTEPAALEAMKHPEQSPFACLGPRNAMMGNDPGFLKHPEFKPFHPKESNLDGALEWRPDGGSFLPEIRALAREFGYR